MYISGMYAYVQIHHVICYTRNIKIIRELFSNKLFLLTLGVLIGIFTTVLLSVLLHIFFAANKGTPENIILEDTVLIDAVNSPDSEYTAVAYISMGGGAAGYCNSYVAITHRNEFHNYKKDKNTVAASELCEKILTLSWTDNNTLLISNMYDVYHKETNNKDKKVKINYYNRPASESSTMN